MVNISPSQDNVALTRNRSGINALCYYLAYILETYLDFSQNMSLILASVAFTQYAIFSWPPYFYIDKIGRRWTVMLSSIGCAICMAVIAGCLIKQSYSSAAAAVAFMFLYLDCFTLGILPVSWSYSAEIQPLRVRNKATAVGVFSHWTSNCKFRAYYLRSRSNPDPSQSLL